MTGWYDLDGPTTVPLPRQAKRIAQLDRILPVPRRLSIMERPGAPLLHTLEAVDIEDLRNRISAIPPPAPPRENKFAAAVWLPGERLPRMIEGYSDIWFCLRFGMWPLAAAAYLWHEMDVQWWREQYRDEFFAQMRGSLIRRTFYPSPRLVDDRT